MSYVQILILVIFVVLICFSVVNRVIQKKNPKSRLAKKMKFTNYVLSWVLFIILVLSLFLSIMEINQLDNKLFLEIK